MKKQKHVLIIGLLVIMTIALSVCIYQSYMFKQGIEFTSVNPKTSMQLMQMYPLSLSEDKISLETTKQEIDSLLFKGLQMSKKLDPNMERIMNIHYDLKEQRLYLLVNKDKKYEYTFTFDTPLQVNNGGIEFKLQKGKLGKFHIPVSKGYYRKIIGITDTISLPLYEKRELFTLKDAKFSDDVLTLDYIYQEEALLEAFKTYVEHIDENRLKLHEQKKDLPELYIEIGQTKNITLDKAKQCIVLFVKDTQAFKGFQFILTKEGQKALYEEWGTFFGKNITLEEWYALAENDLNEGFDQYHEAFVEAFYSYLYEHPNYTVGNGTLLIDQRPISYEEIMKSSSVSEGIYEGSIIASDDEVSVVYDMHNDQIKKQLFTRR